MTKLLAIAAAAASDGRARAWGVKRGGNDAVVVGSVSCLKDSPLAVYERPGEWMVVTHKIPVAQLPGGKLTRFETGLFNDGNGYVADPPDGNNWNNDTGVKMTIRDIAVYTDRPE